MVGGCHGTSEQREIMFPRGTYFTMTYQTRSRISNAATDGRFELDYLRGHGFIGSSSTVILNLTPKLIDNALRFVAWLPCY